MEENYCIKPYKNEGEKEKKLMHNMFVCFDMYKVKIPNRNTGAYNVVRTSLQYLSN